MTYKSVVKAGGQLGGFCWHRTKQLSWTFWFYQLPHCTQTQKRQSKKQDSLGWHAEAAIFFVLRTEEAKCAGSPACHRPHLPLSPGGGIFCGEAWASTKPRRGNLNGSVYHFHFRYKPMSCEDGRIKGLEIKGRYGTSCKSRNLKKKSVY